MGATRCAGVRITGRRLDSAGGGASGSTARGAALTEISPQAVCLHPGEQTAEEVAARIVEFVGQAQTTLDVALYDVRLPGPPGDVVAGALRAAAERGVALRLAYNDNHDQRAAPPPRAPSRD
jgi:hypothetical protein